MSNRFKKAVIDDVLFSHIDEALQANLLDFFEHAMKATATTLAHNATFDTTDFATAQQRDCAGYVLIISRVQPESQDFWRGEFTKDDQQLSVIGHLE